MKRESEPFETSVIRFDTVSLSCSRVLFNLIAIYLCHYEIRLDMMTRNEVNLFQTIRIKYWSFNYSLSMM